MANPTARTLKLLTLLQSHRTWSAEELSERLAVSERTVRRDIDRLRELGYPVLANTGPAGGYQLAPGKTMPPLVLDEEEAMAIALSLTTAAGGTVSGIAEAAVRALAKMAQTLPPRVRDRINQVQATVTPVLHSWVTVDAMTIAQVAQSCRDHERIRFSYNDRLGAATERNVEPHQLVLIDSRWYLVGYDRDRQDWRTFRIDRMSDLFATKRQFEPRKIPGGDASEFVVKSRASMPSRHRVKVALDAPLEEVQARTRSSLIERVDDQRCSIVLTGDSIASIAMTLLWLDYDYQFDQPDDPSALELSTHLAQVGKRIHSAAAT